MDGRRTSSEDTSISSSIKSSRSSPYRKLESELETDPSETAPTAAGTTGGEQSAEEHDPVDGESPGESCLSGPRQARMVPYKALWSFATALDYGLAAVGTLAAGAHGASLPFVVFLLARLVDLLGANQSKLESAYQQICQISFILLYTAGISVGATWLEEACWMYTGERQALQIRKRYLKALISQDVALFETAAGTREIINTLSYDMNCIHEAMGEKVGAFVHKLATFLVGVLLACIQTWQVALLTLGTLPLILGTGFAYRKVYTKCLKRAEASYGKADSIAEEAISQVRTLYSFGGENRAYSAFSRALQATTEQGTIRGLMKGIGLGFSLGIVNISWALQLWYGDILVRQGKTNGGALMGAIFCVMYGGMALGQAIPELQIFVRGRIAAFKVFDVIHRKSNPFTGVAPGTIGGAIEFHNVDFSYPSCPGEPILKDLSFKIAAGQTVALVGAGGSGKSTVISLIERFYDPSSGQVTLDGRDLRQLQLRWLRSQIGLVSQEPQLFLGTIRQNIRQGKLGASDADVEAAALATNAHSFICKFPDRYETRVGESGLQLSPGQSQRIAIARAIVKKPRILLLDDATSALDVHSELMVHHALASLMRGRTTLVVAHRLSTVKTADAIIVLDGGRVVETGTHGQLVDRAAGGVYASLVRLQENKRGNDHEGRVHSAGSSPPRSLPQSLCASPFPSHLQSPFTPRQLEWQIVSSPPSPFIIELPPSPVSPRFQMKPKKLIEYMREKEISGRGGLGARNRCRSMVKVMAPEWCATSLGSVGAAVTGSLSPLFILFLFNIIEQYYSPDDHKSEDKVHFWCIVIAGLGVACICSNIVQHFFFNKAGDKTINTVRRALFKSIMRNEVGWFDAEENSSSALTRKMASRGTLVKVAISDLAPTVIQYTVSLCVAIALAFSMEWKVAAVTIVLVPFSVIASWMKRGYARHGFVGDLAKSHLKATMVAGEAVSNIRTVAAFCLEDHLLELFERQLQVTLKRTLRGAQKRGCLNGLSQAGNHLANAMCIWYLALLVKEKQTDYISALKVFHILVWMAYVLTEAIKLLPDFKKGFEAIEALQSVASRKTEIHPDAIDGLKPQNLHGRVEFQNITFSYPMVPMEVVLSDFNLVIAQGETVALVGPSGSGKSSILALMERFYDPTSGKVLFDEFDVKALNLKWLRKRISYVQQQPALFAVSIRENIQYGKENATEAEVVEAARKADAHRFVSALPCGYDSCVGDQGVYLSESQKQRIAIARAIIRNPQFLLVDEAASALDEQSEKEVQVALDNIMLEERRTTIVIARGFSNAQRADSIALVMDGQILERGSHSMLLRRNGVYARLVNQQNQHDS